MSHLHSGSSRRKKDSFQGGGSSSRGTGGGGGGDSGSFGKKRVKPSSNNNAPSSSSSSTKRPTSGLARSTTPPGGSSSSQTAKVTPFAWGNVSSGRSFHEEQQNSTQYDPLEYITLNLVGQQVQVQTRDGSFYQGIFHSSTAFNGEEEGYGVVLRMARKLAPGTEPGFFTTPPSEEVTIRAEDFVQVIANEVAFVEDVVDKRRRAGFQTDTEISNQEGSFFGRELTPWTPPADAGEPLESLEDANHRGWDQFATNKELFGVKSTYDEEFYTIPLDRGSHTYQRKAKEAQRIADAILKAGTSNQHIAEERGFALPVDDDDMDEEDRYSTVFRDQSKSTAAARKTQVPAAKKSTEPAASSSNAYQIPAKRRGLTQSGSTIQNHQRAQSPSSPLLQSTKVSKPISPRQVVGSNKGQVSPTQKTTSVSAGGRMTLKRSDDRHGAAASSDESEKEREMSNSPILQRLAGSRARSMSLPVLEHALTTQMRFSGDPLYAERLRIRQQILSERKPSFSSSPASSPPIARRIDPNPRAAVPKSPLSSPLIGHPERIDALNLTPAKPQIPENIANDFKEFKLRTLAMQRERKMKEFLAFSTAWDKRASAPNSPLLRSVQSLGRRGTISGPAPPLSILDTAISLTKEMEKGKDKQVEKQTTTPRSQEAAQPSTKQPEKQQDKQDKKPPQETNAAKNVQQQPTTAAPPQKTEPTKKSEPSQTPSSATTPATPPAAASSPAPSSSASTTTAPGAATTIPSSSSSTAAGAAATPAPAPASSEDSSTTAAASTTPAKKPLASKLNPNAKAFTPKRATAALSPTNRTIVPGGGAATTGMMMVSGPEMVPAYGMNPYRNPYARPEEMMDIYGRPPIPGGPQPGGPRRLDSYGMPIPAAVPYPGSPPPQMMYGPPVPQGYPIPPHSGGAGGGAPMQLPPGQQPYGYMPPQQQYHHPHHPPPHHHHPHHPPPHGSPMYVPPGGPPPQGPGSPLMGGQFSPTGSPVIPPHSPSSTGGGSRSRSGSQGGIPPSSPPPSPQQQPPHHYGAAAASPQQPGMMQRGYHIPQQQQGGPQQGRPPAVAAGAFYPTNPQASGGQGKEQFKVPNTDMLPS
ncbi:Polyadenylate-binding protein-interacting protein 3 [Balamuthia mandrillaris]